MAANWSVSQVTDWLKEIGFESAIQEHWLV